MSCFDDDDASMYNCHWDKWRRGFHVFGTDLSVQQNVLYTDFISIDAQELPVNHLGGLALPVLGDLFRHLPTLKKCFFLKWRVIWPKCTAVAQSQQLFYRVVLIELCWLHNSTTGQTFGWQLQSQHRNVTIQFRFLFKSCFENFHSLGYFFSACLASL